MVSFTDAGILIGPSGDKRQFLAQRTDYASKAATTKEMPIVKKYKYNWDVLRDLTVVTGVAFTLHTSPCSGTVTNNFSVTDEYNRPEGKLRALPTHFESAAAEMSSYRTLMVGWDGVGSVAPSPTAIGVALEFLRALPPSVKSPDAAVNADGSVGWLWNSRGVYVDVTFFPDGHLAYYGQTFDRERVASATLSHFSSSISHDLLELIALL